MRRWLTLAIVVVLTASGCGTEKKEAPTVTTAGQPSSQSYSVTLDGKTDAFNGEFGSFFPTALSVHAGDTVKFELPRFSGVPHTVTLGTLVDKAVAKVEQLGPQATASAQENSAELLNLPDVFPHKLPQGPPDANQSAGQPCYLDTGVPPLSLTGSAPACPKVPQPAFNGTQSFYNSGVLDQDGASYAMEVAPTTKPGTYSMICLIHRAVMTAKLTVAGPDDSIPSPTDVTAAGKKQFDDVVKAVAPVAESARKLTPDKAMFGTASQDAPSTVVAEILPKAASIPVGGSVVWTAFAFHTITLGAADSDVGLTNKAPDGTVHLGQKAGTPVGFKVPSSIFEFPPPDPPKPLTIDLGSYDGSGFRNTGIFGSIPPGLITFKLRFTKAGTYPVRCLIHPDMEGTVNVG